MKESRFIELLNLYVDQQLSPQEAAELEAELQQNPARHRTYRQYCRMQKACAELFEHERSAAPASAALSRAMADADRKIVAFPERERRRAIWPVGFSIGAVAAAACVAFVIVRQNEAGAPVIGGASVAVVEPAPVAKPDTSVIAVAATSPTEEFTSVFTVPPLRPTMSRGEGLFVSASSMDETVFNWTRDVQLKPLSKVSVEEFAFGQSESPVMPAILKDAADIANGANRADDPATEMVTFEFTK